MLISWLDIGSGRNPFYFTLPNSITVNKFNECTGDWFCDAYNPDPHIVRSATALKLPCNSVENILFHYSVGSDSSCVITPTQFEKIAVKAYSWLVPGGSILVRSKFHGRGRFNPGLFAAGLVSAGFLKNEIDLVLCNDLERLTPAAAEVLLYYSQHDAVSAEADNTSAFLIATKENYD